MAQPSYTLAQQQIPPVVYQQAGMYQLGDLTRIYKPALTNPLAIIGLALGVSAADILLLYLIVHFAHYIFYILLFLPPAMIGLGIYWLLNCNLRVYTFNSGFIHAKGSAIEPVRWDQVAAIWEKVARTRSGLSYTYTVSRVDGKTFVYRGVLKQHTQLGATIKQEVAKVQVPRAIAAYNAGAPLTFGPVNVDYRGLNNGREIVPWHQVGSIVVREGVLNIEKDGRLLKWASIKAESVPNLPVLNGLVAYVIANRRY